MINQQMNLLIMQIKGGLVLAAGFLYSNDAKTKSK